MLVWWGGLVDVCPARGRARRGCAIHERETGHVRVELLCSPVRPQTRAQSRSG